MRSGTIFLPNPFFSQTEIGIIARCNPLILAIWGR